jgi:hypothetical protein
VPSTCSITYRIDKSLFFLLGTAGQLGERKKERKKRALTGLGSWEKKRNKKNCLRKTKNKIHKKKSKKEKKTTTTDWAIKFVKISVDFFVLSF